ncbi:trigger factor [Mycoplasma phocoeninasale]|uniref:Trigger factor n=1 Tax=Mycoplasma phocoeninasale TaxID=2726117 RepID=A0A858U5L7_9MOLU|nr:trigger factor [Mycoplasma phocoeninasale]MBN0970881.1 trigger factor [Mycoplasma phocoeninasale]QJG66543.1 trigger factor [Mycoplasma phocoeninasale]
MSRIINKEKTELRISYVLEGSEWQEAIEKAREKLRLNVQIPGFRKGKVPAREADKRISLGEVLEKALRSKLDSIYSEHIAKEIEPTDQIVGREDLNIKEFSESKVVVEFIFPIIPEVKLGDYSKLGGKIGSLELSKEELLETEMKIIEKYVVLLDSDEPIKLGDEVNFDFKGFVDGEAFDGGDAEGYDLKIGSKQFIPGFEEKMVGLKRGEEADLDLVFPENYHVKHLAGKKVIFKVKINNIKTPSMPKIDEEFIKQINITGINTLEEFQKFLEIQTYKNKLADLETKFIEDITKKLIATSEIAISDSLLKSESRKYYENLLNNLKEQGISEKEYLEFTKNTKDDIFRIFDESATENLKKSFIFGAIAGAEGIKATEEAYNAECQKFADLYKIGVESVKGILRFENFENKFITEKVIETLMKKNDPKNFAKLEEIKKEIQIFDEKQTEKIVAKAKADTEAAAKAKAEEEAKKAEK